MIDNVLKDLLNFGPLPKPFLGTPKTHTLQTGIINVRHGYVTVGI